ncbi:hypothetical protein [Amycolatopsis sp. NPDC004169]|uniref:hypothetical protein n=1 Tax=Amycolatopsis sp. NPDC004169 TaxID=3154453 RepID=UPI0033AE8CF2
MKGRDENEADITTHLRDRMGISEQDLFAAVREHLSLPTECRPRPADVWAYASAVYRTHLANGTRYWASLTNALAERDSAEKVMAEKSLAEEYDRRFRSDYEVTQDASHSFVAARGHPDKGHPYHNVVEPDGHGGHLIKALHNYAKEDANGGKRLPNSEILWQQFKGIAGEAAELSGITRTAVVNVATRATIYLAYPNGEVPGSEPRLWEPGTEGFLAVLGTENAKSAAFLLMDHAHRIRRTIDAIRTTKDEIAVSFASYPG